jgi:hypothetical protein
MADNVIQFPSGDEQKWSELETTFRRLLAKSGAEQSLIDWVCADIKPRYFGLPLQFSNESDCPPDCWPHVQAAVGAVQGYVHHLTAAMWGEMISLEILLYRAKFGDGSTDAA